MYLSLVDMIRLILPHTKEDKQKLDSFREFCGPETIKRISYLAKTKKVELIFSHSGISTKLLDDLIYPEMKIRTKDEEVRKYAEGINTEVFNRAKKRSYKEFGKNAEEKLLSYIAPNIFGLEAVKEAALLQLFASEPVHILLLGDPGTGKTDILKSIAQLHPIVGFGLGSGTSGAGLGVMMKGNEVVKGLLPRSDKGICCIDELNLMKRDEYAYLYSAMEKGFITYDKGSQHLTMDAKVRVLATANPTGDKFVGKMIDTLKKQLPFDEALLSRFHLVFLIRKPDAEGFAHITKKIIENQRLEVSKKDLDFIRDYVSMAEAIDCEFPNAFKEEVVDFVNRLKEREGEFMVELTPRIVVGLIRLAKARARLGLRNKVTHDDLLKVEDMIEKMLIVRLK